MCPHTNNLLLFAIHYHLCIVSFAISQYWANCVSNDVFRNIRIIRLFLSQAEVHAHWISFSITLLVHQQLWMHHDQDINKTLCELWLLIIHSYNGHSLVTTLLEMLMMLMALMLRMVTMIIVIKDNTKAGQVLSSWWKVRAVSYCVWIKEKLSQ